MIQVESNIAFLRRTMDACNNFRRNKPECPEIEKYIHPQFYSFIDDGISLKDIEKSFHITWKELTGAIKDETFPVIVYDFMCNQYVIEFVTVKKWMQNNGFKYIRRNKAGRLR